MMNTSADKRILYFQSGGPTSVINSSFQGIFDEAKRHYGMKVFVSPYGVQGLLNNEIHEVKKSQLPILDYRPGAYWGSLRMKLPEDPKDPIAEKVIENLLKNHIAYVFVNGGNDSMDTAYRIHEYALFHQADIKVIGIPKTIDNDLALTDHSPGFGSACKFIINSTITISLDDRSYQKGKVNIIETMGRDSGFLAASASLASLRGQKPDYIFVPEVPFDMDSFLDKVKTTYEKKGRCLIVAAEGIKDKYGNLISFTQKQDVFHNKLMGGVSSYLSSKVAEIGLPTRAIELNVLQRCSSYLPSYADIHEARRCGKEALHLALKGQSGVMVSMKRVSNDPYKIKYESVDIKEVADKETTLPLRYLNTKKDNINDSYIQYVAPLIKGNPNAMDKDGILKLV